ncbi:ABC transporter ATP-binding protein [Cellulosimicrobium cellulans]|uniref:ABC transporter ATP-binding protein n=1 Tax=Cellulosimicrobium cellulans TaxID=1710 RepID=A0A1Y0HWT4_CELCE|nr:ABC transporter ATP-binding protein [Cellulosimicrobium cellulans]ARU51976.1 ABC transporter ATP-binding protein [Cellulosimicrobium cellulans]
MVTPAQHDTAAAATSTTTARRGGHVRIDAVSHRFAVAGRGERGFLARTGAAFGRLVGVGRDAPSAGAAPAAPTELAVLDDVTLDIPPGQLVALVGPSGCGKSTLLRLLAGLAQPSEGDVSVDGTVVTAPHPSRALVFQDPNLFPWRTVLDNVRLGPQARHRSRLDADRVRWALDLVGLTPFADALPATLSGGMAQRAALARALVNRPRVFLLDEPLGKLDALTRLTMQDELLRLWQAERFTALLVTHDVDEALRLADRVVVLSDRPARVLADLTVDLDRPRDHAATDYLSLRREILHLLGQDAAAGTAPGGAA